MNLRKVLVPIVIILASIGILTAAFVELRSGGSLKGIFATHDHDESGPAVGKTIDDAKIHFWKGEAHSLKLYLEQSHKKVVLLNFWATWCQACLVEMPSLLRAWEQLGPEGFEVLAINVEVESDSKIQKSVDRFGLKFPIIADVGGAWADIFDIEALPTSVLLDSDLQVLAYWVGERDWDSERVLAELRAALQTKP